MENINKAIQLLENIQQILPHEKSIEILKTIDILKNSVKTNDILENEKEREQLYSSIIKQMNDDIEKKDGVTIYATGFDIGKHHRDIACKKRLAYQKGKDKLIENNFTVPQYINDYLYNDLGYLSD